MPQITVAMLEVNEIEPDLLSQAGGRPERRDNALNFGIGKEMDLYCAVVSRVENRMAIGDYRFRAILGVGAAKASRVRQLQPDQQMLSSTISDWPIAAANDPDATSRRRNTQ